MVNVVKIQAKSVYCTGDIHGNINAVLYQIKQYDIRDTVIVCCGDIGLGFNKPEYYRQLFNKVKKTLSKYNDYLILIRGNHDDPRYFDGKMFNDKRIKAVSDYTVVEICDENEKIPQFNILCIGGATSVDRVERMIRDNRVLMEYARHHVVGNLDELNKQIGEIPMSYWRGEQPVYDEQKIDEINKNYKIDAVATHTCPSFCKPLTKDGIKYWMERDVDLEDDIDNERETMDKIYHRLTNKQFLLSNWCYGHYHFHNMENINGIRFTLLDMERNGKMDMVEIYNNSLKK